MMGDVIVLSIKSNDVVMFDIISDVPANNV